LGSDASTIIERAGIHPTVRGEALNLQEFIRIAESY